MKRRPPLPMLRIFVFLLLGTIINAAVAWGVAMRPDVGLSLNSKDCLVTENPQFAGILILYSQRQGELQIRRGVREYFIGFMHSKGVSYDQFVSRIPRWASRAEVIARFIETSHSADCAPHSLRHVATGWPLLSFQGSVITCAQGSRLTSTETNSLITVRGERVPLGPLWIGITVNTLFYAAILWLLFAAPLALRRRRRIKRGLCPACAYPVGVSDVCTECGAAVTRVP